MGEEARIIKYQKLRLFSLIRTVSSPSLCYPLFHHFHSFIQCFFIITLLSSVSSPSLCYPVFLHHHSVIQCFIIFRLLSSVSSSSRCYLMFRHLFSVIYFLRTCYLFILQTINIYVQYTYTYMYNIDFNIYRTQYTSFPTCMNWLRNRFIFHTHCRKKSSFSSLSSFLFILKAENFPKLVQTQSPHNNRT